jgi:predicted ATPase
MPVFLTLLSLPPSERYPMIAITPEAQRKKTLAALLAWLVALSQARPVTLVVEDLHWIDPSTLELLGLLLEAVTTARAMLVLTFRPEFEVPWLPHPHVDDITLRPLTEREMAEVVASVADGRPVPPRVLAQVVARTDGVPLFAEELTKNLIESGMLDEHPDRSAWNCGAADFTIPSTLQDSLMARLDRLGSAKEVAQIGAVLGRRFSHELLEIVSGMPSARLCKALDKLVAAELLFQRGLPPAATYAFKHVLIQDTAYQSLLKATRREYHGRIAEVLASRSGEIDTQQPELIADHYTRAGNNERALQYWTKAAQLARGRGAHMEALGHLSRAMELLAALPQTPARTERELGLLVLRGGSISATRGLADPEVEGLYASALRLSEQLTDKFQILIGLWSFYLLRADLRKARELAEQLVEIAERERARRILMASHRALGTTLFYMGQPVEGLRHLLEARSHDHPDDAAEALHLYGQDAAATCSVYAGMVSWVLGYTDDAATFSLAAVELARRANHPYSLAVALVLASCQFQFRRDVRTARTLSEECVTLSNERGFALWAALGNIVRGWAIAYDGDPVQGIAAMRSTLDSYVRTGATLGLPYFQSLLADATIPFQPDSDTHQTLGTALERLESTGELWIAPEVHRLTGELHVRDGKLTEADACFSRAVEIARAQGARAWELRALESLNRLRASALSYAAPASHGSGDMAGRRRRTARSTIHTACNAPDRRNRDRSATSERVPAGRSAS